MAFTFARQIQHRIRVVKGRLVLLAGMFTPGLALASSPAVTLGAPDFAICVGVQYTFSATLENCYPETTVPSLSIGGIWTEVDGGSGDGYVWKTVIFSHSGVITAEGSGCSAPTESQQITVFKLENFAKVNDTSIWPQCLNDEIEATATDFDEVHVRVCRKCCPAP